MKIDRIGIYWGKKYENEYEYYFYFWNPLPKGHRYWGREDMWYDGPHPSLGLWFFNFTWRTKWTSWNIDDYIN